MESEEFSSSLPLDLDGLSRSGAGCQPPWEETGTIGIPSAFCPGQRRHEVVFLAKLLLSPPSALLPLLIKFPHVRRSGQDCPSPGLCPALGLERGFSLETQFKATSSRSPSLISAPGRDQLRACPEPQPPFILLCVRIRFLHTFPSLRSAWGRCWGRKEKEGQQRRQERKTAQSSVGSWAVLLGHNRSLFIISRPAENKYLWVARGPQPLAQASTLQEGVLARSACVITGSTRKVTRNEPAAAALGCPCPEGRDGVCGWWGGQDPDQVALRSSWSWGCLRCDLGGRGLSWVLPGLTEEKQVAQREFGDRVGKG